MPEFDFMLILDGIDLHDDVLNALYEAGCNDGLFGKSEGVSFAHFAREAPDLETAITSAIRAIESVKPLHVIRVEIDEESLAKMRIP